MQKLFKLQHYGLTCVVTLTGILIGNILVEVKNMSAVLILVDLRQNAPVLWPCYIYII